MIRLIYFLKNFVPKRLRKMFVSRIKIKGYREYSNRMANPFSSESDVCTFPDSNFKMGIVYSVSQYHKFWISACKELGVSYEIIYLSNSDWMDKLLNAKCDALLVWSDITTQTIKTMQDERLLVIAKELKIKVYPEIDSLLLYENKRLQHYWLKANQFPVIPTKVFYDENEIEGFLSSTKLPIVMKSNLGASASGVYIFKTRAEALKKSREFMRKGYKLKGDATRPRQQGGLYVQEYLPGLKEWRMVRIGNSYFGHGKDMKGQFHSGSGKANWDVPPTRLFELLFDITERGGFSSMDVDIFEDENGNLYVNELQALFGNSIAKEQLKMDGTPGRMLRDHNGDFHFEAGDFCRNHLCNLRLEHVIKSLGS